MLAGSVPHTHTHAGMVKKRLKIVCSIVLSFVLFPSLLAYGSGKTMVRLPGALTVLRHTHTHTLGFPRARGASFRRA